MMTQTFDIQNHDELELLLPWYVNDTLEATERAALQQHLDNCSECCEGVALLQRMQGAVRNEAPSPIVPRQDVEGLLRQLDVSNTSTQRRLGRVKPRILAAAAAVVVLGAAVLLFKQDLQRPDSQVFETATSTNVVAASGYILAISFQPATNAEQRERLIAAIGGTSMGPGEQPDTLRVAVTPAVSSLEELVGFTREVESNAEVVSVTVVAVQLPVAK